MRVRSRWVAGVAVAVLVVGTATGYAQTVRSLSVGQFVRLTHNVLSAIDSLTPAGSPDPGELMSIGVALARPNIGAEDAFVSALYDPHNEQFHKFLTPEQIAQRFGVARPVTERVVRRLEQAGLSVDTIASTGDYISARGPVAAVERAFGVSEMRYVSRGVSFLANTTGPLVASADHVISVVGLNTLQKFSLADSPQTRTKKTRQDSCTAGVCMGNTTPQDLWSVYQQPAKFTGKGQRAAIIGEGKTDRVVRGLAHFEEKHHLPAVQLTVHCVERRSCGSDTSGDGEWQIDTQASTGMAPRMAGEDLYFSQSIADSSINLAFLGWLDDPKAPKQASASLGECEQNPLNSVFTGPLGGFNGNQNLGPTGLIGVGNGEEQVLDPQLKKAVMRGHTLFASSGDSGSSCGLLYLPVIGAGNGIINSGIPEASYPAASPWVTSVGGTVLYTTDGQRTTRSQEYAWTYGGGGTSYYEPAPSWQAAQSHIVGRCLSSPSGNPSSTGVLCRGVPDIAAQSGDIQGNGYDVCGPSTCFSGGGTSLSSPLWLGMWTRIQSASKHNLGFAAAALYKVGNNPVTAARDFYDITVGGNGLFVAGPGWDYTTGFGTPRVSGLIDDIAHAKA